MPEQDETVTDETVTEETASEETTAPGAEGGETDPAGTDALGDAGKRALDSMKTKWRDERDKRKALEDRLTALETAKSGETETPEAIKAQATREATTKANARIVRSEIKAAAAGKFADPADALAFIDPAKFEVDDNGDIDEEEIKDAIEELLTRKPHLAAKATPRFQGSGDGGAARKASGPTQVTREELDRMSPDQIVKAKREGRLKDILSGK
ncbi:hypothetical protein ACWEQ3_01540 [Streptomyces mirabilis]